MHISLYAHIKLKSLAETSHDQQMPNNLSEHASKASVESAGLLRYHTVRDCIYCGYCTHAAIAYKMSTMQVN